MTLLLEIEYLSGISFAASEPALEAPEWPPQPDRVFSALVATWAARGEATEEAEALEWLERLPPPLIDASEAELRTAPVVFVPPNDPQSDRTATAKQVMPGSRRRQPRRFPSARPHDPIVRLLWHDVETDEATLAALQRLAHDVAYIGHSASLTRCRFCRDHPDAGKERNDPQKARRRVYPGRMAELRREFEAGRRPLRGETVRTAPRQAGERMNTFGERWLLLEHVGGTMPDIRACALVARTIRDTLLSGYRRIGLVSDIPEIVSGHTPVGEPSRRPHLAVIPLPFVGFPHADGHIMGFALVPPDASAILDDQDFRCALRALAPLDEDRGRRILTVRTREGTLPDRAFSIQLSPAFEPPPNRRSLDPALYIKAARDFSTVTPIALDRHLKAKDAVREEEKQTLIAHACRNIGLPEPEVIATDKHAALEGVPSAYPSATAPHWMRWRLPRSLATRQLTHAFIRFPVEVVGPVILGAGRHLGLGLCRPVLAKGRHEDAIR